MDEIEIFVGYQHSRSILVKKKREKSNRFVPSRCLAVGLANESPDPGRLGEEDAAPCLSWLQEIVISPSLMKT